MMEIPVGLTVRLATMDDAVRLRNAGMRIFVDTFGAANTPQNMAAYLASAFSLEQVTRELQDLSSTTFITERSGDVVAYARLHSGTAPVEVSGSSPVELVRLYVDRAYQGRGAAASLMERCLDVAREASHDVLWLGVWEHNPRAQAFYAKYGFERVGMKPFMLGDDQQTDWLMARFV